MQMRVQTVLIFHRVQGSQLDSEVGLVCEKVEYLTEYSSSTTHRHVTKRHSLTTNRVRDRHAEEGGGVDTDKLADSSSLSILCGPDGLNTPPAARYSFRGTIRL
jgi:hypothetical protein